MELLAKRLHEANKVARQQSKKSHETAKRYYDCSAKWEFTRGELVYLHDPTHKRGKARKFSYQYRGPFEIEQRISPLIYKLRMTDGTSAIIHINRLKKAYSNADNGSVEPFNSNSRKQMDLLHSNEINPRGKNEHKPKKIGREISHSVTESSESDESDEERNHLL